MLNIYIKKATQKHRKSQQNQLNSRKTEKINESTIKTNKITEMGNNKKRKINRKTTRGECYFPKRLPISVSFLPVRQ